MFLILCTGGPPFLPETFDRILLDAPCSGMGQRPNMACTWTLKEVTSYQPLQRRLFTVVCDSLCYERKLTFASLMLQLLTAMFTVTSFTIAKR